MIPDLVTVGRVGLEPTIVGLRLSLRSALTPPARAHDGDAGFDLCANEHVFLEVGAHALVCTGVSIAPPAGTAEHPAIAGALDRASVLGADDEVEAAAFGFYGQGVQSVRVARRALPERVARRCVPPLRERP